MTINTAKQNRPTPTERYMFMGLDEETLDHRFFNEQDRRREVRVINSMVSEALIGRGYEG